MLIKLKKPQNYEEGRKIANTQYVQELPYYKKMVKMYKILSIIMKTLCIISILMTLILLSRPAVTEANDKSAYNRDIMLCMDVSDSVNALNEEIVNSLKNIVKSLKGERFGISIFNTSSVMLVPLTDDYDYVLDTLNTLEKYLKVYNSYNDSFSYSSLDDVLEAQNYLQAGTLVGINERGSSIIGDGLASCMSYFGDFEEERTRIIIFTTDNDVYGREILDVKEAGQICKNKGATVFAIAPMTITSSRKAQLKSAVEVTGGVYYEQGMGKKENSNVNDIVNNIEQRGKNLIKGEKEVKLIDKPEIPFVVLNISLIGLFILDKKVNL